GVSGADLPGEDQIASPVAVTHEQRADAVLAALGIGEAADDELLPLDALRLHPVGVSSRPVARVAPLGNESFEPQPAGLAEDLPASTVPMLGVPQHASITRERTERRLALLQRQAAKIAPVQVQ